MRKKIYYSKGFSLVGLFLTLTSVFLLAACDSGTTVTKQAKKSPVRPAKLIEISQKDNDQFLNYPAVIQSQQLTVLTFEVGGMLSELLVIEAQKVQKGEPLAKLDQRDLKAKLKSARAQYENADAEYQRALKLIKEDAISRSTVEQRKSKRDVSKSQLDTAQKALQDTVLLAPYSGAIAKVSVEKQQIVQPGEPAITLLGKEGLEAKINLPSSIIARTSKQSEPANDSYLVLDSAPDLRIPATFKEASLEADTASQTYEVTFSFENPKGINVLPGMNAVLWFKDPSKSNSSLSKLSIPLTAIGIDGDQKYVWLVDSNAMTVSKRQIVTEDGVGTSIAVSSGLKPGDIIVSAGISSLSEGMKVSRWSK